LIFKSGLLSGFLKVFLSEKKEQGVVCVEAKTFRRKAKKRCLKKKHYLKIYQKIVSWAEYL